MQGRDVKSSDFVKMKIVATISMVKPEKGQQIENGLINMARSGRLNTKVVTFEDWMIIKGDRKYVSSNDRTI